MQVGPDLTDLIERAAPPRVAEFELMYLERGIRELDLEPRLPDSPKRRFEYVNVFPPARFGAHRASAFGVKSGRVEIYCNPSNADLYDEAEVVLHNGAHLGSRLPNLEDGRRRRDRPHGAGTSRTMTSNCSTDGASDPSEIIERATELACRVDLQSAAESLRQIVGRETNDPLSAIQTAGRQMVADGHDLSDSVVVVLSQAAWGLRTLHDDTPELPPTR
jgi:hypothetical protein